MMMLNLFLIDGMPKEKHGPTKSVKESKEGYKKPNLTRQKLSELLMFFKNLIIYFSWRGFVMVEKIILILSVQWVNF